MTEHPNPFITELLKLREQAGTPSLEKISMRAGRGLSKSTLSKTFTGATNPTWTTASLIVLALGGSANAFKPLYVEVYGDPERPVTMTATNQLLADLIEEIRGLREELLEHMQCGHPNR